MSRNFDQAKQPSIVSESTDVSDYIAQLVAAAPPVSAEVRAKLSDLLVGPQVTKGVA